MGIVCQYCAAIGHDSRNCQILLENTQHNKVRREALEEWVKEDQVGKRIFSDKGLWQTEFEGGAEKGEWGKGNQVDQGGGDGYRSSRKERPILIEKPIPMSTEENIIVGELDTLNVKESSKAEAGSKAERGTRKSRVSKQNGEFRQGEFREWKENLLGEEGCERS
ncbi:hypothetical protein PIB30_037135 [Stylosanthes scabra]|uniref:Zinc knuckle CX2CX4HX4C domain-containing protein n=1 Tax=Stylosanthes scabra TaxID=79078 RepID=A0ABU6QE74_9FABA|nr:hypothetical protein [Stylosanthes scabra]